MNITDELRELQVDWKDIIGKGGQVVIANIADRIDAKHISMVDQTRNKAWNEGFDDGYASAGDYEAALQEHGWIRLPKDANGEYIHLGDVMEDVPYRRNTIGRAEVVCMLLNSDGWVVSAKDPRGEWVEPTLLTHHHEPTVEDVLEEYRIRYYDLATDMECKNITNEEYAHGISSLNAEYAAKLQLKESE